VSWELGRRRARDGLKPVCVALHIDCGSDGEIAGGDGRTSFSRRTAFRDVRKSIHLNAGLDVS
jgi:hypothetical protein